VSQVDQDSSVGRATCHGLAGPGIETPWGGGKLRTRADRPWGLLSLLTEGVYHPPPSIAEVKERVELYLYSPSESSWSVLG
jgi:hypothetical protein